MNLSDATIAFTKLFLSDVVNSLLAQPIDEADALRYDLVDRRIDLGSGFLFLGVKDFISFLVGDIEPLQRFAGF